MVKIFLLLLLVIVASAAPDPYLLGAPLYSAAYTAPVATATIPAGMIATVPAVSASYPFSSMSAYSYGSSYTVQDFPLLSSPAAPLVYSSPYTSVFPYAYATDYYYRK